MRTNTRREGSGPRVYVRTGERRRMMLFGEKGEEEERRREAGGALRGGEYVRIGAPGGSCWREGRGETRPGKR